MTTQSLPHDTSAILTSVEAFFDELPATRRRKRTRAEIDADYDITPETENYTVAVDQPSITCELDYESQVQMFLLLRQLSRAQSDVVAQAVATKILAVLGMSCESPAFDEAMERTKRKGAK